MARIDIIATEKAGMAGHKRRYTGEEIICGVCPSLHGKPHVDHGDAIETSKAVQKQSAGMIVRTAEDHIAGFERIPCCRMPSPGIYGHQCHAEAGFQDSSRVNGSLRQLRINI